MLEVKPKAQAQTREGRKQKRYVIPYNTIPNQITLDGLARRDVGFFQINTYTLKFIKQVCVSLLTLDMNFYGPLGSSYRLTL